MDAVKILLAFLPVLVMWGAVARLWDWLFMWINIALIVGGVEVVSVFGLGHWASWTAIGTVSACTGLLLWLVGQVGHDLKTISKQFWAYFKTHFWQGWGCIASVVVFFVYFSVFHLGFGW